MSLKFKKLSNKAITPTRNNQGDAGIDLYSIESYQLAPLERKLFHTDIAFEIPESYYGRIADRSGNALKKGLHALAGVVDAPYRGECGVLLVNLNSEPVQISIGDRIAQIIIERYYDLGLEEVSELSNSNRGSKGYGASGN